MTKLHSNWWEIDKARRRKERRVADAVDLTIALVILLFSIYCAALLDLWDSII